MTEPLEFRLAATDAGVLATFGKVESGIKQVAFAFNKLSDLTDDVTTDFKQVEAAAKGTDKAMADVATMSTKAAGGLAQVDAAATGSEKALKDTAASSKHAAEQGTFLTGSLDKVKAGFAAVGTLIAGFGVGLAAMTQQVTSNATEVDRWAQRLGVGVDWMSKMQFAAAPLGLDMNSLGEALSNATEKLSEAALGGNDSTRMFAQLGIAAKDSAGNVREIDAVLPELATALQGMTNDADRVTVGLRLFGEEGSRLVPILLQGEAGLTAFQARADLFGTTLSSKLVGDSKAFQSGLQGVIGALQGTANAIVGEVLPGVNALIPQITAFVIQLKESSLVTATLVPLLGATTEGLGGIANHLGTIEVVWNAVNEAFNRVVAGFLDGVGLMTNGLSALLSKAADAAEWLKLPGVAESLRQAAENVSAATRETEALGKVARETAEEWATRNVATADSFGKIVAKVKDAQAQTKSLDDQTKQNKGTIDELVKAYQALGLETAKALKDAADKGVAAFRTIVQDQESNTKIIAAAWEALEQKLIAAYGRIPPRFKVIDEAIKSGNRALIEANLEQWLTWIKAAEEAYDNVPDALRPANQRIVQGAVETGAGVVGAFQAAGTAIVTDINGRWIPAVGGMVTDINGRLMPALQAGMVDAFGHVTRAGQAQADATRAAWETSLAAVATKAKQVALETEQATIASMERMRSFVTVQLGAALDVAVIKFGTTIAELERQYVETLNSFNGLAQRASVIGGDFLRQQQDVLLRTMAEIERRRNELRAIPVRSGTNTGSGGTPNGPIDYGYGLPGMAAGGLVPGYGPPDSLVTRVSPGERIFSPGDNKEIMQLLREALPSRRERQGSSSVRGVAPQVNITVAYTGVQNPAMLVRGIRDALRESIRRGEFALP